MSKDMDVFYKKAFEFEQVKRNSEKLEVYRFVRRK